MPIRFELVTAERIVFQDDVDVVIVPGVEGELAVLPRHAPLLTVIQPGEIRLRKKGEESSIVVTGGFLEVRPDKVTVLADAAERAEEIDASRAEAAMKSAEERMKGKLAPEDLRLAESALRRAVVRLKVARRRRGSGARTEG
ncbi:MAG: F0F1 ATP synthase subunit epsilon [Dehalococcoidia bacterium]|nr:F0F1 ATP synthase subunit epsilon [Dehalococcoidia bacterium]